MIKNIAPNRPAVEEQLASLQQVQESLDLLRAEMQKGVDCDFVFAATHEKSDVVDFKGSANVAFIAYAAKGMLEHLPPSYALAIIKAVRKNLMDDGINEAQEDV